MAVTIIRFAKMPKLQWHYDHVINSLYVTTTCRFHLYIFFHLDFVVPLFSPLFYPTTLFLVISLYMAYSIPLHQVPPPAAPPQLAHPISFESDPSETVGSSFSSSSGPDNNYVLADPDMANGFLFSESIQWSHLSLETPVVQSGPLLMSRMTLCNIPNFCLS